MIIKNDQEKETSETKIEKADVPETIKERT